ncbi:MAG: thymidylate synthase [Candidatus Marinimicrobia bacterium]|nr:thymidylate synthase [Candidatus Neomarinimicrobiota bacterium]
MKVLLNYIYSNVCGYIGINNKLVAHNKQDLQYFQKITTSNEYKNIVIMGYNTWISIPDKRKPLSNRMNIILSQNNYNMIEESVNAKVFRSIDLLFKWLDEYKFTGEKVFIIGGADLFNQINRSYKEHINLVYITEYEYNIEDLPKCDEYISYKHNLSEYKLVSSIKDHSETNIFSEYINNSTCIYSNKQFNYDKKVLNYTYKIYQQNIHYNSQEYIYLDQLSSVLNGSKRSTRNGNVYSKFGVHMEFNLLEGFPLLTTKRMPWKVILKELLWFINGSTDNTILNNQNVHIWDKNASIESLKSRNLDYEEGDLGPIYGFQWRNFGAKYIDCNSDYTGKGIDQLKYIINEIRTNPTSRRIIINAWNPVDIPNMALPPCHILFQIYIDGKYIDGQLYQRSGDMFLGVPFNISSYAFLLSIIGSITGYIPRRLIHIIGDAHIYEEHLESVKEQLTRIPHRFPKVLLRDITNIDCINLDNIQISDYRSYSKINAPMKL